MGKKAAWDDSWSSYGTWPQHGGATSWRDKPSKGQGKKGKDYWGEHSAPSFPRFENMSTKGPKPSGSALRRGEDDGQDLPGTGPLVHFIQKLANTIRRAEGRLRKCEEERLATEAKWEESQKELKRSFLQERQRRADKLTKISAEQAELLQQKEEAITELQEIFLKPQDAQQKIAGRVPTEALQEWEELMRVPEDPWTALPNLLAGALDGGTSLKQSARQQLLGAIGLARATTASGEAAPRTPPSRAARPAEETPPARTRKDEHGLAPEPPLQTEAATYSGTDGQAINDPYQASPSTNRAAMPTRSRSRSQMTAPRLSVKTHTKGPVQTIQPGKIATKLDEKRAAALAEVARHQAMDTEIEEIEDDENEPVSTLLGARMAPEPGEE